MNTPNPGIAHSLPNPLVNPNEAMRDGSATKLLSITRSVSYFIQDLRYGARVLLRSPGATAVAILALALGIGVNTSCFISVNALVLHPLPFPHLERLMTIWETVPKLRSERDAVAPANFLDWKQQTRSFQELAAYQSWDVNLTGTRDPERVQASLVSPSFFSVLGTNPALGRTFSQDEDQPAHSRVVVVSQGFWRQHLAGSPDALGKLIELGGSKYKVVGIMPNDFDFPLATDVWAPLAMNLAEQHQRAAHTLLVLGRLKPNVSVAQARAETDAIAQRLESQYPRTNEARGMAVVPIRELLNPITDRFVLILLGSATFVLLLACANVGNLQLARAAAREKEIAVRAALGANRFQIARQLFAESLWIAVAAGILGLLLASWNLDLTRSNIPAATFRYVAGLRNMHVDANVVIFTFADSLLTGLLCCLPAIFQLMYQRSRTDLNVSLREGGRTTSAAGSRSRVQSVLIVAEVALALVLLIGAGFMVSTFQRMLTGYYGYDPKNLLTLQVSLPPAKYSESPQLVSFYDRVLQRFQTLPGVRAAAVWTPGGPAERLYIEGRPEPRPGEPHPDVQAVSDNLLPSTKIPLVAGRFLSEQDRPESPRVVVISESLARHYWPGEDPIGRHIKFDNSPAGWLTIVGISGNTVKDWFTGTPALTAYVPYTQLPPRSTTLVIRTAEDPMQAAAAARAEIRKIDKDLPVYDVKSMDQFMSEQMHGVRVAATTMTTYALIALLLAATGIFAVISYFVVQRRHDIGVRIALGANTADVLGMTLRRTLRLTGTGLALGVPAAFALSKLMSSLLFNTVRLDWMTFAGCTAMLACTAFLASYFPALRASKIDPIVALRQE